MKRQTGVWIDGSRAIIITFFGRKREVVEVISNLENRVYHDSEGDQGSFMGRQHIGNEKKFDERKKNQLEMFLKDVLASIGDSDDLYIFGPGETKTHLKQRIEGVRQFRGLKEKLKAIETSDSMTENQMIARVRKFYGL